MRLGRLRICILKTMTVLMLPAVAYRLFEV